MRASVIISTYQRPAYFPDVLASVVAQDFPKDEYEILVVDNASQPTSALSAQCSPLLVPPVCYVHEPRNGLHNVRHTGAERARGDVLVYIDDDVVCPSGWLAALLALYCTDSEVACVGGRILPLYEVEPPAWLAGFSGFLSLLDRGDETKELYWPEDVYGCNFSIRKSVLIEAGGFNPDSFSDQRLIWCRGDGETGLLLKIYKAGYKVVYTPHGWLYHRVPASRMTAAYMAQRAFNQALSDGFTAYRGRQDTPGKLLLKTMTWLLRSWLEPFIGVLAGDNARRVQHWVIAAYWRGRARYDWRLFLSIDFRHYVTQESFWREHI
jgi:glycosyltransferase involved in cell wall biosynthesis